MRVIHVLHSMSFGGAEVLVHNFLRATRDRLSQTVICLEDIGPLGETLRAEGVRVEVLAVAAASSRRSPSTSTGSFARCAPTSCARTSTPPTPTPRWPSRRCATGPGLVFIEHGRHYPDVRRPKRVAANTLLFLRYTRRVIAVCGYVKRLLVENEGIPASRIDVIYNGVDPARFDPDLRASLDPAGLRASLGLSPDALVVTCVARLHPVKDHPTLVRAFALAAREVPNARLLLVGGGDPEPLRQVIDACGVADRVVLAGARADIPAVYAASDLFAMASLSEGTSVTLLEAMLSERAALVTDVGGNPEIVARGLTGELVPRGDHAAMGAAMVALLRDPERCARLGAAGRRRVLDRFTQQRMHDGWVGALQDAAAG